MSKRPPAAKPTAKPTAVKPTAATRLPVAHSYRRYSDPKQRKGDSVRRQEALRDRWLKEHPDVPLDTTLKMTDRGRSAFRRKNWDKYALAGFVKEIEAGNVLPGDYLLVENLDRLSREECGEAVELFLSIVNRGVIIVQLSPAVLEFRRPVDTMSLMFAIVELSRGNSESKVKSARILANWDKAITAARETKSLVTTQVPAWIEVDDDGTPALIPERKAVVKSIFEMAAAGYGMTLIVKRLVADGVPAFGNRVPDDEGHFKKADGERYGCGEWRVSYVRWILNDRRAVGEYQPKDAEGKKKGDPIPGYFPPAVTEEEYFAARAAVAGRHRPPGRVGEQVANLFGGLLRNARDGGTYYVAPRNDNGLVGRVLINRSAVEAKGRAWTFDYGTFQRALLSRLAELSAADVVGKRKAGSASNAIEGELSWVRQKKEEFRAVLLTGDVAVIAEELAKLEAREAELLARLDDARADAASPPAEAWKEAVTLIDLLDNADDREDVRPRLRAALRRTIKEVWLIVVPRGRTRLCEVQVFFARGGYRRYWVARRSPYGNQSGRQPGRWAVVSVRPAGDNPPLGLASGGTEDLRDPTDAELVRHYLEELPANAVEMILESGEVIE
jgi:DNA invertase Pin-like site-specific DNA recombinase